MENSFKSVIEKSKSLLVLLPTKPYFDQVAAGLSLFLALRDEKEVNIASPSPMTVEFNRLIGVNKISQDLGSKNLIMRFSDYKANDIERVSYDIEDGQFKLTVIPKPKINPPVKEQVQLSYSGVSSDAVVLIGGANETHFPAISTKDLAGVSLIHIGTKDISLSSGKSYLSFAKQASSISEVVADLLKESGLRIDGDIATNLLMGVEKGSSQFDSQGVTSETFSLMADLMRAGGKRQGGVAKNQHYPPGTVPVAINTESSEEVGQRRKDRADQPQEEKDTPKEWLEPKIFKGTSIK